MLQGCDGGLGSGAGAIDIESSLSGNSEKPGLGHQADAKAGRHRNWVRFVAWKRFTVFVLQQEMGSFSENTAKLSGATDQHQSTRISTGRSGHNVRPVRGVAQRSGPRRHRRRQVQRRMAVISIFLL